MPKWRNWQTRTFEGRVRQLVGVRVPPSAPGILKILSKNADHLSLGTTKVQTPWFEAVSQGWRPDAVLGPDRIGQPCTSTQTITPRFAESLRVNDPFPPPYSRTRSGIT